MRNAPIFRDTAAVQRLVFLGGRIEPRHEATMMWHEEWSRVGLGHCGDAASQERQLEETSRTWIKQDSKWRRDWREILVLLYKGDVCSVSAKVPELLQSLFMCEGFIWYLSVSEQVEPNPTGKRWERVFPVTPWKWQSACERERVRARVRVRVSVIF